MKNLLPLFFCLFSVSQIMAQDENPCDTLVLVNGRNLSVVIDSLNNEMAYYHGCDDPQEIIRSMPKNLIVQIKSHREKKSWTSEEWEAKIAEKYIPRTDLDAETDAELSGVDRLDAEVAAKYGPVKRWLFKNAAKKIERKLISGNQIKVNYRFSEKKNIEVEGRLLDIGPEALVLQTEHKGKWEIPKKDIRYIELQRNKGTRAIFGALLMVVSVIATTIAAIAFLVLIFSLGSMGGTSFFTASIVAGLSFIGSLFLFFDSTNIKQPFSDEWEISEKTLMEYKPEETAPDSMP